MSPSAGPSSPPPACRKTASRRCAGRSTTPCWMRNSAPRPRRRIWTSGRSAAPTSDVPAGIGPEIALKAALDAGVGAVCGRLLVGDREAIDIQARLCGITAEIAGFSAADRVDWSAPGVLLLDTATLAPGELA